MKKLVLLFTAVILFFPGNSYAKNEYIYRQGNNPANYVKLESFKPAKHGEVTLNQPYSFTEAKMADILRSLRFNRRALFSDKVKARNVFEEESVEKYTPYLVKAFQKAGPEQAVFLSMAQKRPYYVIRNDRFTQVRMWVTGNELHMDFLKTEAKLLGDYQARTQEGKKMREESVGLRISLEPQEGQKFAFDSADEIIIEINRDWEAIVTQIEAEEERIKQQRAFRKEQEKKPEKKYTSATQSPSRTVSPKDQKSAEARLTELKKLKDKGLISQEDYERKKQEILENL